MKRKPEVVLKNNEYEIESLFNKKEEIKIARELLEKYLRDYVIEGLSDKNLLRQLIYLEVVNSRLQTIINNFDDINNSAPYQLIDTLHKNLSKIVELREKLGLNKEKKDKQDDYSVLKIMQKKFKIWMENNVASRTAICPFCNKMILFKIRVDGYLASKHPFFKDRWIFNEELWKLYGSGRLNKSEIAKILQVSEDYIEHIELKVSGGKPNQQTLPEEIEPALSETQSKVEANEKKPPVSS